MGSLSRSLQGPALVYLASKRALARQATAKAAVWFVWGGGDGYDLILDLSLGWLRCQAHAGQLQRRIIDQSIRFGLQEFSVGHFLWLL